MLERSTPAARVAAQGTKALHFSFCCLLYQKSFEIQKRDVQGWIPIPAPRVTCLWLQNAFQSLYYKISAGVAFQNQKICLASQRRTTSVKLYWQNESWGGENLFQPKFGSEQDCHYQWRSPEQQLCSDFVSWWLFFIWLWFIWLIIVDSHYHFHYQIMTLLVTAAAALTWSWITKKQASKCSSTSNFRAWFPCDHQCRKNFNKTNPKKTQKTSPKQLWHLFHNLLRNTSHLTFTPPPCLQMARYLSPKQRKRQTSTSNTHASLYFGEKKLETNSN